jgi:hypothetical protein
MTDKMTAEQALELLAKAAASDDDQCSDICWRAGVDHVGVFEDIVKEEIARLRRGLAIWEHTGMAVHQAYIGADGSSKVKALKAVKFLLLESAKTNAKTESRPTAAQKPADSFDDNYSVVGDGVAVMKPEAGRRILDAMKEARLHVDKAPAGPEFIAIPDSLRRLSNFEGHGQRVIDELRERVKALEDELADAASYTRHSDYDWDMGFIKEVDHLLTARLRGGD